MNDPSRHIPSPIIQFNTSRFSKYFVSLCLVIHVKLFSGLMVSLIRVILFTT